MAWNGNSTKEQNENVVCDLLTNKTSRKLKMLMLYKQMKL